MLYQAPSPQRKKDPPPRENKLRLFLKRSSEPLLNLQNAAQQVQKLDHLHALHLQTATKVHTNRNIENKNVSYTLLRQIKQVAFFKSKIR